MYPKKPLSLESGDTVAIVSPSWGGPASYPHIYQNGLKELKKLGLNIKEYSTARADPDVLYNNPKKRAMDINKAFLDPDIQAIISTIGGDDSIRILPYLDTESILNNPKILLGFSDTTTILAYLNQLGLVTFYGPSVMAGFSQLSNFPAAQQHIQHMLFRSQPKYKYRAYSEYTEGYPTWKQVKNIGKINTLKPNEGWQWLQGKEVKSTGRLFGGCIEVLEFMKGTQFWPKSNFWDNKILFLETSEDKPSPTQVMWMFRNYGMQGIFDKITGILVGRARDYSKKEKSELYENIINVVQLEFEQNDLPVVVNVDIGHTDPQLIFPLGIKAEIDGTSQSISLIESPTK